MSTNKSFKPPHAHTPPHTSPHTHTPTQPPGLTRPPTRTYTHTRTHTHTRNNASQFQSTGGAAARLRISFLSFFFFGVHAAFSIDRWGSSATVKFFSLLFFCPWFAQHFQSTGVVAPLKENIKFFLFFFFLSIFNRRVGVQRYSHV